MDLAKTMQLFRTNYHVFVFRWTFQQKVAKSCSMREKAPKIINLAKLCNFSSKLPCLCISINFSGESCKKCLISWKSTTNHPFGQIFITFRTNYDNFAFRWTFQEKVAKSASFCEKPRQIIDLAKTLHFDENFWKKLQKVLHFMKKHEKLSIWPKFAIFRANNDVLAFSWTFQKEVAKRSSYREKARENMDFAKTCNFLKKLPCFYVSMNFMAKSWRNCLISWKSTKTHGFGQNYATFSNKLSSSPVSMNFSAKGCKKLLNSWKSKKVIHLAKTLQLFEQATMCLHFDELFRKKSQKVPHFVKKHEKSAIWPKLSTFRANYHVFAFSWTFQQEVAKSASFRGKAGQIIHLAKTMQLFRSNYHVFAFRSTFR